MLNKKIISMALVGAMVFTLASCKGNDGGDTTTPSDSAEVQSSEPADANSDGGNDSVDGGEIVIGGIGPLTGDASIYGEAAMNGATLFFEENNEVLGKKISFITQDDKHDTTDAVNAYNKLVGSHDAVAVIGAVTSQPSSAVAMESIKKGVPIITPTGTAADITTYGDNIFRACYLDPFQGETMANFAFDSLGKKTAAILYDSSTDYSEGVAEAFEAFFTQKGGQIVATETFTSSDQDFKSQLTKIKEANPEVLFLPTYYKEVALITTQAKSIGITSEFLGVDGWDGVLNILTDKSPVEGAYFCSHYSVEDPEERIQNFVTKYNEKYGVDPNAFAALGYDAAKIVFDAIQKAGSTDSAAIVEAIKNSDISVVTSDANLKFDDNRNPIKGVTIIKIVDGINTMYQKLNPEQ